MLTKKGKKWQHKSGYVVYTSSIAIAVISKKQSAG